MHTMKVKHEVILAATHQCRQNPARLYFALRMKCTVTLSNGVVQQSERCSDEDIERVGKMLGRKDYVALAQKLVTMGWLRDGGKGWYYFASQDTIARNHLRYAQDSRVHTLSSTNEPRISGVAVVVDFDKLCGKVGPVRSYFYELALVGMSESNTFSRKTIREVVGTTKPTQRKYEAKQGITHDTNLGVMESGDVKPTNSPFFKIRDEEGTLGEPGATKLAYQMPNTYHLDKSVVTWKRVRFQRVMPNGPLTRQFYFPADQSDMSKSLGNRSNDVTYVHLAYGEQERDGKRYGCNLHDVNVPKAMIHKTKTVKKSQKRFYPSTRAQARCANEQSEIGDFAFETF